MPAATAVEYYLTADDGYMRVDWEGPEPSFVMLAPLHEALEELGVFAADAEAAWPGDTGVPYFVIGAGDVGSVLDVFEGTEWGDFITAGRIRDTLGVSDEHAGEMVELSVREAERLTELLRLASAHGAGLLAVVF